MNSVQYRVLRSKGLNSLQTGFLQEWQVPRRGLFLPVEENDEGLFVWTGKTFAGGETVSIVANQNIRPNLPKAPLFVGVVREEVIEEASASGPPLDAYADAAIHEVAGKAAAIYALNELIGLPDGTRMLLDKVMKTSLT